MGSEYPQNPEPHGPNFGGPRPALDIKLLTEYLDDFDDLDVEEVTDFVS